MPSGTPGSVCPFRPPAPPKPIPRCLEQHRSVILHDSCDPEWSQRPHFLASLQPHADVGLLAEKSGLSGCQRAHLVPPISGGQPRLSEVVPTADSYSRLRKLVRASGRPLLLPGRPTLGPHASLRGLLFDALRSLWWSWPCRRGGMGGIMQIGDAGGMGFYLALAATIGAS